MKVANVQVLKDQAHFKCVFVVVVILASYPLEFFHFVVAMYVTSNETESERVDGSSSIHRHGLRIIFVFFQTFLLKCVYYLSYL